jgi:hypothetical protein
MKNLFNPSLGKILHLHNFHRHCFNVNVSELSRQTSLKSQLFSIAKN